VIKILLGIALPLVGQSCLPAHAETEVSPPATYSGVCDGSAAVALTDKLFAVGSDEDSIIRVYDRDRSGGPLQRIDLSAALDLEANRPESDIEGAARVADRVYWITSHSRTQSGRERPSRERFFATQIVTNAQRVELKMVGRPYENLIRDLIRDPKLGPLKLAEASAREPKARGALNIEGLSATPDGHLLIGFRNPIPNGKALLLPVVNPDEVVQGGPARFAEPILIDLGGLGIRDMACWNGRYVIIAGSYNGKGHARLYEWSGGTSVPRLVGDSHLKALNPEAIIFYPDNGGERFQLLSDDGNMRMSGKQCKELTDPGQQHFRSVWVSRY
jgi:Protein of unknown function (DUF3616)